MERKVNITVSLTKNLGNYESVNFSVSVSEADEQASLDKLYEEIKKSMKETNDIVTRAIQEEALKELDLVNAQLVEENNFQRRQLLTSRKAKLVERIIEAGFDPEIYKKLEEKV